jgi:hypothetical protein
VGFADTVGGDGAPLEPAFVDPFLDGDMGPRLQLEIAPAGVLAVVLPERTFDIHGVRIVPLDQVAVVAVHRPHKGREGGQQVGQEAAPESGGFLRKVEGEVGQAGAVREPSAIVSGSISETNSRRCTASMAASSLPLSMFINAFVS